jgi:hypothetical protein
MDSAMAKKGRLEFSVSKADERAPDAAVPQRIVGFHQDEERHWVAELECGHSQHVRHDPPWQVRPWVVAEAGRKDFIGKALMCAECGRKDR